MAKIIIGADTETHDELLKTAGYSWKYNKGYVLCTSLYYEADDKTEVIAGLHNTNCPFTKEQREKQNETMISILKNPDVCLVGANIIYDIGWWCYEYNITPYEVKCSFVDCLQAESILDEFGMHSLETVSWKYLKYGKTKDRIEDWVHENISTKGDFRKYLKDAPWDLLCEYVIGDAKNPVKVWRKQLTKLKEQDLCARCKLEFDCILPTLAMSINGMPFSEDGRKRNLQKLIEYRDMLKKEFCEKYDMPNFKVTASRQIASFCDKMKIPYRCKITLKGYNGKPFSDYTEIDGAYARAKKIVSSFRYVKSIPVAYVPSELAERTCDLLSEEGFMFNCSANVDKKFFASQRENYPEIALIADWKLAEGIISKILGEEYGRFFTKNFKGENCIRPQFKITNTISFRYSSNMPNCISGEMRVLTDKGWKKIKNLKIGDSIVNGNGDLTTVKNIWNKGIQNCLLTVSANGYKIVTTPEHKVWTGTEEKEIKDCEQVGIIERRADCETLQIYADKRTNIRCIKSKQKYSNLCFTEKLNRERVSRTQNTAQNKNSRSLLKSSRKSELCERVFITRETLFQRFMLKIQNIFEQGKELSEEAFNTRADSRTAQYESSTSEVQEQWLYRKTQQELQRGMFRFKRIYNCVCRLCGWTRKQSKNKQKGICRCFGDRCSTFAKNTGSASYRHESLKQQLGQLSTVYNASTQDVAHYATKATEVYDIEVASSDHSFICEGFRVFNCQQIPSKGGFTVHNGEEEINVSFPELTRALFTASKGCVFGKIDYGQIEYRLICNIACGESGEEVRRQYAENPHLDFHQYVVDLTGLSRKYAKNMSFGVSFGMGLASMAESFGWTMEKAEEISEQYHQHMPFVQPTLELVGEVAKKRGYIKTVCGSHARLPNPNKGYTMLNRYTQGSGAECLKSAIVRAYKDGLWEKLKVANTVHDELNFPYLEPTEESMINLYKMAEYMRTTVQLRIPLEASPELGDDWAHTKEVKEWIELRDENAVEWQKASDNLKKAVNICDKLLKENKVNVC